MDSEKTPFVVAVDCTRREIRQMRQTAVSERLFWFLSVPQSDLVSGEVVRQHAPDDHDAKDEAAWRPAKGKFRDGKLIA